MSIAKELLKTVLPQQIVDAYGHFLRFREHRRNAMMNTEEVFTEIYAKNKWGGEAGTFTSGTGTINNRIVGPYVVMLREWLQGIGSNRMTVVDLGCGDFRVGQQLADLCEYYIGVDIVRSLVQHNTAVFGSPRIEFRHLNIIEDPLPDGSICFVRQVLQHLSNAQIAAILPKLKKYQWTVITEYQPSPKYLRCPNIDKPHGYDTRRSQGSGVFLEEPPFSIPRDRLRYLMEVEAHRWASEAEPGVIRTFVLSNDEGA